MAHRNILPIASLLRFGAPLVLGAGLAIGATGCAVGTDPAPDVDVRPATLAFRLRADGDREWIMRLTRDGDRLAGQVMRVAGSDAPSAAVAAGVAFGTMPMSGKTILVIEPPGDVLGTPAAPAGRIAFEGHMIDGSLEGTLQLPNEARYIVLVPVTLGARSDQGGPLVAAKRVVYTQGDCTVDVQSLEFFGLEATLQAKLNAIGDGFAQRAGQACSPTANMIRGSLAVSLARPEAISLDAETVVPAAEEQPADTRARERHNVALTTGNELSLFGDILVPGSESALAAAFDAAVSAFRTDALSGDSRASLRHLLRSELDEGTLRFGISETGLVFDVPEINQPHVASVFVSFAALAGALQPGW